MIWLRRKSREWTTWAGVALFVSGFVLTAAFDARELAEYERRWSHVLPIMLHAAGVVGLVMRDPKRRKDCDK